METSLLGRATFGGLASGFDTNALLEGLLAAERLPLQRIEARRSEIDSQRGLMRQLNTKLLDLRKAAQALDNRNSSGTDSATTEEFLRYSGSSTNDDIVSVTAGIGASPGEIDVKVLELAKGSREFSTVFASDTETNALTSGQSIRIQLPNADPDASPAIEATDIVIAPEAGGAYSLQDIRDQINTSADNGGTVRADILQINENEFRLVLTSTGTGESNQLSITGDLALQADQGGEDDDRFRQRATNAVLEIFGQEIRREDNLIDDVLPGITLKLEALSDFEDEDLNGPDDPRKSETVTIEADVDEIAKQLDTFVKAYNDVMSFIDGQFSFNEGSNTSGPLAGDFTLRQIQAQLREIVSDGYKFVQNPNNPFAPSGEGASGGAISNIGIELGGSGRLSVNKETLEEALALDPRSVREFLSGRILPLDANPDENATEDIFEEGFATRIANSLEQIVRSGDGLLANRDKAFASRLGDYDDSIDRFERRLGQREETLIQRFAELERIVSGLQGQQGFLTSL